MTKRYWLRKFSTLGFILPFLLLVAGYRLDNFRLKHPDWRQLLTRLTWKLSKIGLVLALLLPFVAYGLSNLYLMSPKGRSLVSGKITNLTGFEASLKGATWSPWNGITLRGLRIEQPAQLRKQISSPLLLIESVRVHPTWSALKDRRLSINSIDIKKPELVFPVELFSLLPSAEQPPQIAQNNPIARGPVPQARIPSPGIPPFAGGNTNQQEAANKPLVAATIPETKTAPVSGPTSPPIWVNFSDASFKVVSTFSDKPLSAASEIRGSVPLGGKLSRSMIKIGPIECLGNLVSEQLNIPLRSQGALLATDTIDMRLAGIDCKFGAAMSFTRGLPFQVNTSIPEQHGKKINGPPNTKIQVETIKGQGRFQGFLTSPISWQGQWILQALAISGEYQKRQIQFDHGHAFVAYGNGMLRCVDARVIGDSVSVLGNAALLKDGRMAASARIVSGPENLISISKFFRPDQSPPHLTPLHTPQRAALDLQVFGTPWNLFFMPDPRSKALPMTKMLSQD